MLLLPPLGYGAAGVIGGALPRGVDRLRPREGVAIAVEDNGVHVSLVLPKMAARVDWRGDFPARDLADPRFANHDHIAIGWGERGFFLGTPRWRDLRAGTVIGALAGSDATLLHVEHVPAPVPGPRVRMVTLRPAEYRLLAVAIRTARGRGAPLPGYAGYDAFYPARGRYDAVRTCNAWVGEALARSGVHMGRWTPFAFTVTWWL